jgi:hypothetical protein
VSLAVVVAVAAFLAFAGMAYASEPGGGGGSPACASAVGTTPYPDTQNYFTACWSFAVGFEAYNASHSGDSGSICKATGYELAVFLSPSNTKVYDQPWCPDGVWHYYNYNNGASNASLYTWAQYFYANTHYEIDQYYNNGAYPYS